MEPEWIMNPFAAVFEILAFIFPTSECGIVLGKLKIIILNENWFCNLRVFLFLFLFFNLNI